MKTIVAVNPFECRMWALHDRLESQITAETCRVEIDSFARHGQLMPVLGRPLSGDPKHKIELIYGARRLFVARHLNKPLLAEIRKLNDREAIVAMDIENRQRCDISPYERGLSFALWLRTGHFNSQEDIGRALQISASHVCRLLKLAHLPSVVIDAFGNSADIRESWGATLTETLQDSQARQRTLQVAREIGRQSPRPPARQVYRALLAASVRGPKIKPASHDVVVKDRQGSPLFRIRHTTNSLAVILPVERVSARELTRIREAVTSILQPADTATNAYGTHPTHTTSRSPAPEAVPEISP